jgi:hypothetical protein
MAAALVLTAEQRLSLLDTRSAVDYIVSLLPGFRWADGA